MDFYSQSLHHNILLGTIPTAWTKILDENNLIGELFLIADLSFANRAKKSDKQRGAPEFISNSSEDIFSHLPVSYISQRVSFLSNGIVKCTELLASVIQMSTQLDVQSLKEENIGPLLMMAFEVIVLGNIYAQVYICS